MTPVTTVRVMTPSGSIDARVGSSFTPAIKDVARQAGLGKFKVFVNGEEVKENTAPSAIEAGVNIILFPFDTPA